MWCRSKQHYHGYIETSYIYAAFSFACSQRHIIFSSSSTERIMNLTMQGSQHVIFLGEAVPACPGLEVVARAICAIPGVCRVSNDEVCILEASADLIPFVETSDRFLPRRASEALLKFCERVER